MCGVIKNASPCSSRTVKVPKACNAYSDDAAHGAFAFRTRGLAAVESTWHIVVLMACSCSSSLLYIFFVFFFFNTAVSLVLPKRCLPIYLSGDHETNTNGLGQLVQLTILDLPARKSIRQ